MGKTWRDRPNRLVRGLAKAISATGFTYVRLPFNAARSCNICGYSGPFKPFGRYRIRPDAICPSCGSSDRERLLALFLQSTDWSPEGKAILHFAPEKRIVDLLKPKAARYVTADLFDTRADENWNIEDIACPDESFDAVFCSHVLEHVDTPKALGEINRVLKVGGIAFLMVPINEALAATYFDDSVTTEDGRYLHFFQPDHVRVLGRDFMDQVRAAGFGLFEYQADAKDVVKHGLELGEKVFVAKRLPPG